VASIRVNKAELKYWRLKRVMTRAELIARANVGASTYNNLESGWKTSASPETVRAIAKALKVSPEKLVEVIRDEPDRVMVGVG
jgi:transcriptional regulator with XRE-family HTH domain